MLVVHVIHCNMVAVQDHQSPLRGQISKDVHVQIHHLVAVLMEIQWLMGQNLKVVLLVLRSILNLQQKFVVYLKNVVHAEILLLNGILTLIMVDAIDFGMEDVKGTEIDFHPKNNVNLLVCFQKVLKDVHCRKLQVLATHHMLHGILTLKQEVVKNFYMEVV